MGIVIDAREKFAERRKAADLKRGNKSHVSVREIAKSTQEIMKSTSEERTERLRQALEDMKNKDK